MNKRTIHWTLRRFQWDDDLHLRKNITRSSSSSITLIVVLYDSGRRRSEYMWYIVLSISITNNNENQCILFLVTSVLYQLTNKKFRRRKTWQREIQSKSFQHNKHYNWGNIWWKKTSHIAALTIRNRAKTPIVVNDCLFY